ncbi:MAG: hypothetical protein K5779_04995 [Saccharofermentans sp.]|nr:hypothetical protein [Saccharofermentans sp.]
MSPLDMLIFLFFILITIKAFSSCLDYWKDREEESVVYSATATKKTQVSRAETSRNVRPSAVRITPIKRADTPVAASSANGRNTHHIQLKDKGAA